MNDVVRERERREPFAQVGPGVVADIFREADMDGDGKVSCDDFAGIFYRRNNNPKHLRPPVRGGGGGGGRCDDAGDVCGSGTSSSHVAMAYASCSG